MLCRIGRYRVATRSNLCEGLQQYCRMAPRCAAALLADLHEQFMEQEAARLVEESLLDAQDDDPDSVRRSTTVGAFCCLIGARTCFWLPDSQSIIWGDVYTPHPHELHPSASQVRCFILFSMGHERGQRLSLSRIAFATALPSSNKSLQGAPVHVTSNKYQCCRHACLALVRATW